MRFRCSLVTAFCVTAGTALGAGNYNIYGIHFYGDSPAAESTVKNDKGMYSVEMLYTESWAAMSSAQRDAERNKLQAIKDKGFRIILRLDYSPTYTIPPVDDWTGRYYFAYYCGSIANKMASVVDLYVIGNEMTTHPQAGCRDALWYAKVFNGHDSNCCYDQIKANDSTATVMMGALTAWPYYISEIGGNNVDWLRTVQNNVDQSGGTPVIDGYALHAYSGKEYFNDTSSPTEDPRFSDVTGLRSFIPFLVKIYEKHGPNVPVHITETNTYWFANHFAQTSYRSAWIKEAYQTIDEWNQCSDMKIDSLVWFVYSHLGITDPNSDIWGNSLMRTDNPLLNQARADLAWVTANTNMVPGYPGGTLRFQAENFTNSAEWINDVGLNGVDYYDTDNVNAGGEYRNGSENQPHVDIGRLPDWSGFFVGWMAAGEWLRYETIAGGRNYRPRFRYSRGVSGDGSVTLSLDGTAVATLNLPSTGSWDTYTTSSLGTQFYMPPGYHHLTVSTSTGSINIDWFELVP